MYAATAGTLNPRELVELRADARSLLVDTDTGTAIEYRSAGARAYDATTGQVATAETTTSITGYVSPLTTKEIERIDGAKLGDVRVLISTAQLSSAKADDRFTVATIPYSVYQVDSGPVDAYLTAYAHRMVS